MLYKWKNMYYNKITQLELREKIIQKGEQYERKFCHFIRIEQCRVGTT